MQEQAEHNVLISWSGERSKAIAALLRRWLDTVVPSCRPFMSDQDIGVGQRWQTEIASRLSTIKIGVFIVTPENQHKPWVNFEAGAISREVVDGLVMTLIVGMDRSNLSGPLEQFQNVMFERDDMLKMVIDINQALGDSHKQSAVRNIFELSWSSLDNDVRLVPEPSAAMALPLRTNDELIKETLDTIRDLAKVVRDQGYELDKITRIVKTLPMPSRVPGEDGGFRFTNGVLVKHRDIERAIKASYDLNEVVRRLNVPENELLSLFREHYPDWRDFLSEVPF